MNAQFNFFYQYMLLLTVFKLTKNKDEIDITLLAAISL